MAKTDPIRIKHKLIEKIEKLTPTSTPRELMFLSKSLERLNNAVRADYHNQNQGEMTTFEQQHVAPLTKNRTHANAGKHSSPPEFGLYSSHYFASASMNVYDERGLAMDHHKNMWCNRHAGGHGGQWSYWSSGQRQSCDSWNGNPCYYGQNNHTHQYPCHNEGADSVGMLGNSNMHTGTEAAYSVRHWRGGNQSTGRAPRHEYRNENYICGECEPSDKEAYLVYDKQTIYLRNRRVLPGAGASANFSQKATSNGTTNTFGTLTHNQDRQELAVMNHHNSQKDGWGEADWMHQVKCWTGVPKIDIATNLGTALNDANSWQTYVRFDDGYDAEKIPTWSNTEGPDSTTWPASLLRDNNGPRTREGQRFNIWHPTDTSRSSPEGRPICVTDNKIVMTDNGDIYYSIQSVWSHTLFKSTRYRDPITRAVDDTYYKDVFVPSWNRECSILNVRGYDEWKRDNQLGYEPLGTRPQYMDQFYISTARGRDEGTSDYGGSGSSYAGGHNLIQSRNKKNVVMQSQYYYFGAGTASWIIDKRFNKWTAGAYIMSSNWGCQWGPFGNEGFVLNFARNLGDQNPAYRMWLFRQNTNSGAWYRNEMGRNTMNQSSGASYYPALVPIIY